MAWLPHHRSGEPPAPSREAGRCVLRRIAIGDLETAASRERWDALAATAAESNPFHESWYLLPALAALDPAGETQIMVLEQGERWLGLLPIARSRHYYGRPLPHRGNWLHGNAFLGAPLVARGAETTFWTALLDHADTRPGPALFFHLADLPLAGSLTEALRQVCAAQGRAIGLVHREERALLASALSPEAYLDAALSGKKRKELRRQHARLSELGPLDCTRSRDGAGLAEWTEAFLNLEAAGWKGRAGSALAASPATAGLFTAALRGAAERGRLERLTLTLQGRPIAMLATFLASPGAFAFKTTFDEAYARFSPGVLLQRENLALLADPALEWCDSCAAADHPMIDHLWRERRAIGRWSVAIGGRARRGAFALLLKAELARSTKGRCPSGDIA